MAMPSIVPMIATHIAIQNARPARRLFGLLPAKATGRSVPSYEDCFERVGMFGIRIQRIGVPDDVAAAAKKRHELKLQALYLIKFDAYERDYLSRRKYKPGFPGIRQRMEDEHRFNQDFWLVYKS